MSESLKLLRFFYLLLALFTIGRWGLGLGGAEYEKTHQVFSIVILALVASAHHAAFARRFRGYGVVAAMGLGAAIGIISQLVILLSTALSYGLGLETFFNHPRALNVEGAIPFGQAMGARVGGLVVNTIINAIAAAIGWLMGAVLPKLEQKDAAPAS